MIRFKLITLLASTVVIGILAIIWMYWRDFVWIENGNLLIFAKGRERYYYPPHWQDPIGLATYIRVPLWIVGLGAIAFVATFVGGVMFAKGAWGKQREAK